MTEEQIVKLALKYFLPYDEVDGNGEDLQWWGKNEDILKFAKEMYNKGYYSGYDKGYSDKDDNKYYNAMPSE